MALSLADLRASRKTDFSSITAALTKKAEGGAGYAKDDEGYFKITRDKAGNGSATLRILRQHQDDELPWVQIYSHAFQSESGKWLIDNCPTTIGGTCPICEENRKTYKSGNEDEKKAVKPRTRKMHYIVNVLVVKDPANPDNEGKVMRWKFGKKIFEMIMDKVQPTFEDETPINIFDPWEGADFKVRMHMADGYPSYSKSTWGDVRPMGTDEEILEILNKAEPLGPLIAPEKFKSYDALKQRFDNILSATPTSVGSAEEIIKKMRDEVTEEVKIKAPAPKAAAAPKSTPSKVESSEDDDLADYFKSIAE